MEYISFYKKVKGKEGERCKYNTRLDTYGCGCKFNCPYCYSKSLLDFRNLWRPDNPSIASLEKIEHRLTLVPKGTVLRLGGMTDCFQPIEKEKKVTYETIKLLNKYKFDYLIVTKSDLVAEYIDILDPNLAHIQVSVTFIRDEKAPPTQDRIRAIELLQKEGFDISVRLSPYVPQFVDFEVLNNIKCDKIIVEFLRASKWTRKWFHINYDHYSLHKTAYYHMPLEAKIKHLSKITGFKEVSVCEDVPDHYDYWKENFNPNPDDCCNLRI